MKPNALYLVLALSLTLMAFDCPWNRLGTPTLSKSQVETYREESLELVKNYYGGLELLTGDNIDSTANQNVLINNLQNDCFRGPDVVIDNNIPEISQDNLEVKQYLKSVLVLADKIEKIGQDEKSISPSPIYYNDKDDYYYMVVTAKQQIFIKNGKSSNKIVDFYINFNDDKGLKPKIYSVQNHQDNVLASAAPITITSDQEQAGNASVNGSFFLFDITPRNADIIIDGKSVLYDGRRIATTPGDHVIELSAFDYENLKFGVHIDSAGDVQIVRRLTPQHGYLFVNTAANSPQNLQVFIDSNMIGQTPVTNYQLESGPHYLEVKNDNGFYKSYNVSITTENATTLTVETAPRGQWREQRNTYSDAVADPNISYQTFYDELSPYGQWVADPQYGNVWVPDNQTAGFTPYYSDGHWVMTDAGNTWVSNEPWGWACYHYGRWTYNSYYNWVWVPGNQWAPAWVTWRSNDAYCGWAPMAPGVAVGASNSCPNTWWVFVGYGHIYDSGYAGYRVQPAQNVVYVNQTTVINNTFNNRQSNRYYSGPTQSNVQAAIHQNLPVYHISTSPNPQQPLNQGAVINLYKPNLQSPNPYAAHPSSVVVPSQRLYAPQQTTRQSGSTFKQDLLANKLASHQITNGVAINSAQPANQPSSIQEQQRLQQQRTQQVAQPVNSNLQPQSQNKQQPAQQYTQSNNQVSEQQRLQQQRTQQLTQPVSTSLQQDGQQHTQQLSQPVSQIPGQQHLQQQQIQQSPQTNNQVSEQQRMQQQRVQQFNQTSAQPSRQQQIQQGRVPQNVQSGAQLTPQQAQQQQAARQVQFQGNPPPQQQSQTSQTLHRQHVVRQVPGQQQGRQQQLLQKAGGQIQNQQQSPQGAQKQPIPKQLPARQQPVNSPPPATPSKKS